MVGPQMTPHMLSMMILEKPDALAKLIAAKGTEPPETPEEAVEKLKDPSISPADRERLQGIASNVKQPEGNYNTTVPQALGQAGSALRALAPDTSISPLDSGRDEQSQMRKHDPLEALEPTSAAPSSPSGFDPDAPGAPKVPAPQGPSAPSGAATPAAPAGAPREPGLSPLTQSLMGGQQTPTVNINVAPQGPNPMAPNPSMIGAMPPNAPAAMPAAAPAPAGVPAAGAPWQQALAGVAQSTAAGMQQQQRAPNTPAPPYNPGALQPQTLAIMQALMQNSQGPRIPNLQALLQGGQ